MTTLIQDRNLKRIETIDDLVQCFHRWAKPREKTRVGLEAEFIGVHTGTGRALPYYGFNGIQGVLEQLAGEFDYEPLREDGNIIALRRGDLWIGLEPGGQLELSAPPVSNIFEVEEQLDHFIKELRAVSASVPNVAWLAHGIHPFSGLDDIPWVPKKRYQVMAEYLGTHGSLSHHMMKRTATNQVNVDYLSEEDAMVSLRVSLGITSLVSAMFAHSSFSSGQPNGYLSRRLAIWKETDPDRTGIPSQLLLPGATFADYVRFVLDIPVMFLVREAEWIPVGDRTFRQFFERGYEGHYATFSDFELHLSTFFPEVRLKRYLEIRGVDGQSPDLIPAVAAFWKGIFYHPDAREEAWKLVSKMTFKERMDLHQRVMKEGMKAKVGRYSVLSLVRELVDISCASLALQKTVKEWRNECVFLDRIREKIIDPGKSPAEVLLEKWYRDFGQNPQKLIQYLKIA
ncbi:MAG: glutamate--cysteine ligase [Candidatus Omnitrophica bacterium]|nr:glutamate--cysteine ligase [Candidatus Omnitrophota bacterium]